jgi:hypothetical protein
MLVTIWRDGGPAGSARKLSAAIRLALPVLAGGDEARPAWARTST